MTKILIVDDDVTFCLMLKKLLERHQYHVTTVFSPEEVKRLVQAQFYEIVLTDLRMPDFSGMDLIRLIKTLSPDTQVIMMTGYADIATAIQSIKQGAYNYIPKPFHPDEILNLIKEATKVITIKHNAKQDKCEPKPKNYIDGVSEGFRRLQEHVRLVAPTQLSVLITGESGTGKEYIARSIHNLSACADKPFIAVDCGAIPGELVASEFFGHVKGSFTGAISDKIGHFEAAKGGTLFLDEIGNLSYNTQIQLLRTLQERVIKPVGSSREIPVDARIIAATNENLQLAQAEGNFREDLYHRLNEFQIEVPPIRDRRDDIMIFIHHFLHQANKDLKKNVLGFEPGVEAVLMDYHWPGNLREMKNVVKRATLLTQKNHISLKEIPSEIYLKQKKDVNLPLFSEHNESEMIRKVLDATGNNKSKTARLLEIDRKTLYNKLKLYNIILPGKEFLNQEKRQP